MQRTATVLLLRRGRLNADFGPVLADDLRRFHRSQGFPSPIALGFRLFFGLGFRDFGFRLKMRKAIRALGLGFGFRVAT